MTFLFYHDLDIQSQFSDSDIIPPQAILDFKPLDFNQSIPVHEKASLENGHHHHCEHGQETLFLEHDSTSCPSHNSSFRLRRFKFLLPTIFFLVVALVGLLAWSCVNGMPVWGVNSSLMRRDTSTGNTNTCELLQVTSTYLVVTPFLQFLQLPLVLSPPLVRVLQYFYLSWFHGHYSSIKVEVSVLWENDYFQLPTHSLIFLNKGRQNNGRQQPIKNPEVPLQPQWDPSGNLDPEDVLRFVSKLRGAWVSGCLRYGSLQNHHNKGLVDYVNSLGITYTGSK